MVDQQADRRLPAGRGRQLPQVAVENFGPPARRSGNTLPYRAADVGDYAANLPEHITTPAPVHEEDA